MPVVIGRLDVLAAPSPEVESADEDPPRGPSPLDIERVVSRAEARRLRREAD